MFGTHAQDERIHTRRTHHTNAQHRSITHMVDARTTPLWHTATPLMHTLSHIYVYGILRRRMQHTPSCMNCVPLYMQNVCACMSCGEERWKDVRPEKGCPTGEWTRPHWTPPKESGVGKQCTFISIRFMSHQLMTCGWTHYCTAHWLDMPCPNTMQTHMAVMAYAVVRSFGSQLYIIIYTMRHVCLHPMHWNLVT